MHRTWTTFIVLIVSILAAAPCTAGGWRPLFNGRDLSGWTVVKGDKDSWSVKDGLISCHGGKNGWLSTDKQYANFEIKLEFRSPPGGNSGVFVRTPREGDPTWDGMEIQILDDKDKQYADIKPFQFSGSLYAIAPATPPSSKPPGQWQTMHIVCNGPHIKVTLNGVQVVDADLTRQRPIDGKHRGYARKTGYIGLQNHETKLDFRKVELKELP